MQNIKIMFRSSRFLVGFILLMTVVLYAVIYPMINTQDPKSNRADNPLYAKMTPIREALTAEDDAAIETALVDLESGDDEERDMAAKIRDVLLSGGMTNALSGAKQVKKTNPLYNEFASLRLYLGADADTPADEAKAREELSALTAHHEQILSIVALSEANDTDAIAELVLEEASALKEAAAAGDVALMQTHADTLLANHEKTYEWVLKIAERLNTPGYKDALELLSSVQKTLLIPKDMPPSREFPFGTDNFSRDILLEMAYGTRLSLTVGLMAGAIATTIGLLLGLFAGYVGGFVDNVISTITNIFIVIPSMIVLILISIALGQIKEAWITGLVIGLTAWPWTARAVRAQTTSLRNRDHVNMARITGYGTGRIILTEILPYIASYVVMAFILQVASGIISEATLAILGLGDPTAISLGRMINWAMSYEAVRSGRWWQFVPVAGAIAMVSFGLYMMNSGMDQVFNPKIRS